jgi:hypothetical protein
MKCRRSARCQHVDAAEQARSLGETAAEQPTKIRRQPTAQPVVAHIETAPMTAAQREEAISALAALIERCEQATRPTAPPKGTDWLHTSSSRTVADRRGAGWGSNRRATSSTWSFTPLEHTNSVAFTHLGGSVGSLRCVVGRQGLEP